MPTVELKMDQWNAVISILATAPWRDANPLLMEITRQLQAQQRPQAQQGIASTGDGHDVPNQS